MPQQINVTRSSMPPFEEYVEEIRPLWESRWLTNMGEKHRQLEQQLAEKLGTGRVSTYTVIYVTPRPLTPLPTTTG